MTMHDQRFDRTLPSLFVELASASTPDYLEAAIERASSRPQRPAWTYPGRWLPVDITTQAVPAARMPWRQLGILALIGLLIAMAAVAFVGAQRDPSPAPPFGLAAAGAIAMERGGDIVTVDHATGAVTPLITGPELESAPAYFRDGTRIAFEREVDGTSGQRMIMVANADGSAITAATREPLEGLLAWSISPDGRDLLVTTQRQGRAGAAVHAIDGSREPTPIGIRLSTAPNFSEMPSYRPPDGREILVVGHPSGFDTRALYVVDAATGTTLRTLAEASPDADIWSASWSPTGDTVSFGQVANVDGNFRIRTHVVSPDGSGDRLLADKAGIVYDPAGSDWSNDGTRMVVTYRDASDGDGERVLVVPANGDAAPVELACDACPAGTNFGNILWMWSPDDQVLLGTLVGEDESVRHFLGDPETGRITPTDWDATSQPTWQRQAP